jgi:hypothetical protein
MIMIHVGVLGWGVERRDVSRREIRWTDRAGSPHRKRFMSGTHTRRVAYWTERMIAVIGLIDYRMLSPSIQ